MKEIITIIIKNRKIQNIRKRYDPLYKTFKTHLTLIYHFEKEEFEKRNHEKIDKYLKDCLRKIKKFVVIFDNIKKSKNKYYLYLTSKKDDKLINLHKILNSKIKSHNKEMGKYLPHITLCSFKDKKSLNKAFNELKKEKIKLKEEIKSIQLMTLIKKSHIKSIRNFNLK